MGTGHDVWDASLALDVSGRPVVVWIEGHPMAFPSVGFAARWNGASWDLLGDQFDVTIWTAPPVVVDNDDRPLIALAPRFTEVSVQRYEGAWTTVGTPISPAAGSVTDPMLAISPDGTIYLAWTAWLDGRYSIEVAELERDVWTPLPPVVTGEEAPRDARLVAGDAGALTIAYTGRDVADDVARVIRWDGSAWTPLGAPFAGRTTVSDIALESSGRAVLLAHAGHDLKVRRETAGGWEELPDPSGDLPEIENLGISAMSVDLLDRPIVAFATWPGGERFARRFDGLAWRTFAVPPGPMDLVANGCELFGTGGHASTEYSGFDHVAIVRYGP